MEAFFAGKASAHATEDLRVPGKEPDHRGAWVDEKDHLATARPQTPEQKIAAAHAIAEAAVLAVSMNQTDDKAGRFNVINTLDRVEDPETRHLMMANFKTMTGKSLETSLETAKWHSERDKEQALDLISPKRDQAHETLVSLPPDKRKKLEDQSEKDAAKILAATRGGHADDDEVAQDIFRVLGPKEPHEIEAIRAAVRANTQGRTIYQELDLSLSGGNEDEALAGLKGDPVHSAAMGLITPTGTPSGRRRSCEGSNPNRSRH